MFALFLAGLGTLVNANETPALRPGAMVCDLNPETGKRAVYFPAMWHDVTETIVTQGAPSELVYQAAVFKRDGTLAEKARTFERSIPCAGQTITRPIILAPEQIAEITPDGRLLSSDGIQIDEAFNLKLLQRKSAFRIKDKLDYWDMVFQEFMFGRRSTHDEVMTRLWPNGDLSTMPRVFAPDLTWVHDLTYLKVDADTPISILVEPPEIIYPTEQDIVDQWDAYAKKRLRENLKSYSCAGSKLVLKDLGADSYPKKTYEDIRIRTPITVTPPKIRYFNLFGTEIK